MTDRMTDWERRDERLERLRLEVNELHDEIQRYDVKIKDIEDEIGKLNKRIEGYWAVIDDSFKFEPVIRREAEKAGKDVEKALKEHRERRMVVQSWTNRPYQEAQEAEMEKNRLKKEQDELKKKWETLHEKYESIVLGTDESDVEDSEVVDAINGLNLD